MARKTIATYDMLLNSRSSFTKIPSFILTLHSSYPIIVDFNIIKILRWKIGSTTMMSYKKQQEKIKNKETIIPLDIFALERKYKDVQRQSLTPYFNKISENNFYDIISSMRDWFTPDNHRIFVEELINKSIHDLSRVNIKVYAMVYIYIFDGCSEREYISLNKMMEVKCVGVFNEIHKFIKQESEIGDDEKVMMYKKQLPGLVMFISELYIKKRALDNFMDGMIKVLLKNVEVNIEALLNTIKITISHLPHNNLLIYQKIVTDLMPKYKTGIFKRIMFMLDEISCMITRELGNRIRVFV